MGRNRQMTILRENGVEKQIESTKQIIGKLTWDKSGNTGIQLDQ